MKSKVFIIAEIGVNHNGSIRTAKKLIKELSKLDIDAVKIQAFSADSLASKEAKLAVYQSQNTSGFKSQHEMLKEYELSEEKINILNKYTKELGIEFMSSVFSVEDYKKITKLNKKRIKIPSGEFSNLNLIQVALQKYKEVILSTGLSDLKEIDQVMKMIKSYRNDFRGITLLHCTSAYPCPEDEVDISSILTIKEKYNVEVGYSDHTIGSAASIMAIALGARVIEKHVTLDNKMKGPDHKASQNIHEFKDFVNEIRLAESMLGDGKKSINESALKNKQIVKKSIYAKTEIKKDEIFSKKNLALLRPEGGISPQSLDKLIGKRAKKKYDSGEIISKNELKK